MRKPREFWLWEIAAKGGCPKSSDLGLLATLVDDTIPSRGEIFRSYYRIVKNAFREGYRLANMLTIESFTEGLDVPKGVVL